MQTLSRRVLLIAFHFPPCGVSSGLQRTLAFSQALPHYGWLPTVLSARRFAYEKTSLGQLPDIPKNVEVKRSLAFDAARHFAVFGRYPGFLAKPDRWSSWKYFAYRDALKIVQKHRPDAIWSTFPTPTAHIIAARLSRETGIPWVADMRDPMVEYDDVENLWYPTDSTVRRQRMVIEESVIERAAAITTCTSGAREILRERYSDRLDNRLHVIPNGYNESSFASSPLAKPANSTEENGFVMLHSGTVYPGSDRGPESLFGALASIRDAGHLPKGFLLKFRATGHDEYLEHEVNKFGLCGHVELAPAIGYREAIAEMGTVDCLLLLQGRTSNPAIPAKLYEYFRSRRPILALAHPDGDTAKLINEHCAGELAPLDDLEMIKTALFKFFDSKSYEKVPIIADNAMKSFDRRRQTSLLADILNSVSDSS